MTKRISIIQSPEDASVVPGWNDYEVQQWERDFLTEGVIQGIGDEFEVTEKGSGANMSVDVGSGRALIEITNTNVNHGKTYKVRFDSDDSENILVTTADSTNPRKDRLVLRVDVATDPNGNASNIAIIELLAGTPEAVPSAPAEPSNAITLAIIDIPASDTTITNSQITDERDFVELQPDVLAKVTRQGLLNSSGVSTGTNTIALTLSPAISSYENRAIYGFIAGGANTGAATLNINGVGAKAIRKYDGSALEANDIRANDFVLVAYEETNDRFRMLSLPGNAPSAGLLEVEAKAADYSISSADSGNLFTNDAAVGNVYFALPAAVAGLQYIFSVIAAQNLIVQVNPGDAIYNSSTLQKGLYSSTAYNVLRIISPKAGFWAVESIIGTWTQIFAKGYWSGGEIAGSSQTNIIAGFRFDTEAHANLAATLDNARFGVTGVSSSRKMYAMGGYDGSNKSEIGALVFAVETEANIAATLDNARRNSTGVYSSTKGYCMGGLISSETTKIDDINFSTEASVEIAAVLPAARYHASGGQSATKGYYFGGFNSSAQDDIYALTFSGESMATVGVLVPANRYNMGAVTSSTKTYSAGGDNSGLSSAIYAFTHAAETISTLGASLDTAKQGLRGVNGMSKGYYAGGQSGGGLVTVIEDLNFSTEASAAIAAVLSSARQAMAAGQNGL